MALASRIHFDLFILVLNNIVFPTNNMPPDKRLKQALKFVAQLKAVHQKPIIGLYGWPKEPAYGSRARTAGRISCSKFSEGLGDDLYRCESRSFFGSRAGSYLDPVEHSHVRGHFST
jgi:hypothetical protein